MLPDLHLRLTGRRIHFLKKKMSAAGLNMPRKNPV